MMGELSKSFHNIARDRAACALAWEHFTALQLSKLYLFLHFIIYHLWKRKFRSDKWPSSPTPSTARERHSPLPLLLSFLPCLIFISVLTSSFTEKYPVYPAPSLPLLQRNIPTRSQLNQVIMTQLNERCKDIAAADGSVSRAAFKRTSPSPSAPGECDPSAISLGEEGERGESILRRRRRSRLW